MNILYKFYLRWHQEITKFINCFFFFFFFSSFRTGSRSSGCHTDLMVCLLVHPTGILSNIHKQDENISSAHKVIFFHVVLLFITVMRKSMQANKETQEWTHCCFPFNTVMLWNNPVKTGYSFSFPLKDDSFSSRFSRMFLTPHAQWLSIPITNTRLYVCSCPQKTNKDCTFIVNCNWF